MILVDANVLLYVVNADARQHEAALGWLDAALSGPEPVGFADTVMLGFLRLATHASVFPRPLSIDEACGVIESWLGSPSAVVAQPADAHADRICELLAHAGSGGNLVSDAHLAALAIEHDAVLATFDRDLMRFPGLRLELLGAQ